MLDLMCERSRSRSAALHHRCVSLLKTTLNPKPSPCAGTVSWRGGLASRRDSTRCRQGPGSRAWRSRQGASSTTAESCQHSAAAPFGPCSASTAACWSRFSSQERRRLVKHATRRCSIGARRWNVPRAVAAGRRGEVARLGLPGGSARRGPRGAAGSRDTCAAAAPRRGTRCHSAAKRRRLAASSQNFQAERRRHWRHSQNCRETSSSGWAAARAERLVSNGGPWSSCGPLRRQPHRQRRRWRAGCGRRLHECCQQRLGSRWRRRLGDQTPARTF